MPSVVIPLLAALACLVGVPHPRKRIVPSEQAGVPRTVALVLPIVGALILSAGGQAGVVVSAVLFAATGVRLVSRGVRERQRRTAQQVTETLLTHVVADVRSGALLANAFTRASEDLPAHCPEELRTVFAQTSTHVRRGIPAHLALQEHPQLAPLASVWALSESHGLAAADLLDQVRARLAAQRAHRGATSASLQGPRATAVILSLLPLAGILLGASMGADPLGVLLGPGVGAALLVSGSALICAGLIISDLIIARAAA
ncbi:type II secretion system F family protein [Corynebacterium tapiri]|uniref:Type II secretion system protein GspF domain-containing protein n=1 Tax=Corynebacterium tapiri TaxID=1448266 RepID=A0A5C4U447_9CORY|nr:type II secretion system F family protein [Corynebacterium tapiri]TNL97350.1 hypothetical protein FHE74_06680 [Corynebacterium tapiri]